MAHTTSYWKKRQDAMMAGLDKRDEKFTSNLAKEYQRIQNELEKDIAYWYQSYGRAETLEYRSVMKKLSPEEQASAFRDFDSFVSENPQYARLLPIRNSIYQLNRLEAMQLSVRLKMAELGVIEQKQMTMYLQSSYRFGYQTTMQNLENTDSFFGFNERQLELTLSDKWFNDKNYSDRIWDNKNTLRNWMTSDLATGLQQGISYDKMIKQLQQRIDVGKFYAKRLVWTESAFFLNTANAHAFQADGIKRYQYVAIIDERTSKTCQTLNGQIFDFANYKPGINAPPMHSFCRSTIVPLENEAKVPNTVKTVYNESESDDILVREVVNHNLSRDEAIKRLSTEFDMGISETSRTKLSETALNQTYSVLKAFEDIYNILPDKIPQVRALTKTEAKNAIARYTRYRSNSQPVEFGINTSYFKNDIALKYLAEENVKNGWFSKNAQANHVMIHEFGHHLDYQLSKMQESSFSVQVFNHMIQDYGDKYTAESLAKETGRYAYSYYNQRNSQTETFAELFSEAYGDTPREIALDFRTEFEKLSKEVIKNARKS